MLKFNRFHKIIVFLLILVFSKCNFEKQADEETIPKYYTISGQTQGTYYNITYGTEEITNLQESIDSLLHEFDKSLSTYISSSLISRINQNDSTAKTDVYFETVFEKSQEIARITNGAFDITVGALANAWGFGDGAKKKISELTIDSLLQITGYSKVRIENGKVIKELPDILLNVNAIAQGYAVDIVCDFVEIRRCQNYLVEIGGELCAKGLNSKGELWRIGIDKPVEDNNLESRSLQAIMTINNKSVATSGNYRQYYEEDGVKYSHTIDPRIGMPVKKKILSASIVANDCMTADAYATACMVMGIEESINLIKQDSTLEAYFIYSGEKGEFKEWYSPEIEKMIEILDKNNLLSK